MGNNEIIEMNIADTIMEKPIGFKIGDDSAESVPCVAL